MDLYHQQVFLAEMVAARVEEELLIENVKVIVNLNALVIHAENIRVGIAVNIVKILY